MKKILIFSLKLALATTLLYWLYDSDALDLRAFAQLELDSKTFQLLGLNAVLLFIGAILVSIRMWRLLILLKFDIKISEAIRVNLASMCLGLVLPGLLGVDAIRATYFCMKTKDRKVDAFTCILADRIVGIYGLILLATIAAGIGALIELQAVNSGFVIIPAGILLVLTLSLGLIANQDLLAKRPFSIVYRRLPTVLQKMVAALQSIVGSGRDLGLCLLITLVTQCINIVNFVIIGILIQDNLPILAHYILNPIGLFFNSVPITPGGLGITESVFAYLYDSAGSVNGALISLLGRLNQYCVYIAIGLPAIFLLKLDFNAADESRLQQS